MRTIQTTYRYRLEPTEQQATQLRRFAGARRFVWNWALRRKTSPQKGYACSASTSPSGSRRRKTLVEFWQDPRPRA